MIWKSILHIHYLEATIGSNCTSFDNYEANSWFSIILSWHTQLKLVTFFRTVWSICIANVWGDQRDQILIRLELTTLEMKTSSLKLDYMICNFQGNGSTDCVLDSICTKTSKMSLTFDYMHEHLWSLRAFTVTCIATFKQTYGTP